MARKIETEKVVKAKKKKHIFGILFFLIFVALCVTVGFGFAGKGPFKGIKSFFNKPNGKPVEVKILDEVKDFGYTVSDRDTKYFKEEFDKLKKITNEKEVDQKAYAEMVARMFVNDLYTLSTKVNKYDVGGIEYYHKTKLDKFTKSVMDTLYRSMLDDTYGLRDQKLPEVNHIETVSIEETTYDLEGTEVDAYEIKLKWTYVNDMGYDNEGTVIVTKENNTERLSVVDFQGSIK